VREHARVVAALARGDRDAAADRLRDHILASSRRNVDGDELPVPPPVDGTPPSAAHEASGRTG
jgi:hypothetical protein